MWCAATKKNREEKRKTGENLILGGGGCPIPILTEGKSC